MTTVPREEAKWRLGGEGGGGLEKRTNATEFGGETPLI